MWAGDVYTIKPNGTRAKRILKGTPTYAIGLSYWSPTGSHIIYDKIYYSGGGPGPKPVVIQRVTKSGGGGVALTDPDARYKGNGWRQ